MKVISVVNSKGGTGKTTISVNVATSFCSVFIPIVRWNGAVGYRYSLAE